jgi:hypothetical protein
MNIFSKPSHVAHLREMKNAWRILATSPERKITLQDLGTYDWIILKWILKKESGRMRIGFVCRNMWTKSGLLRTL